MDTSNEIIQHRLKTKLVRKANPPLEKKNETLESGNKKVFIINSNDIHNPEQIQNIMNEIFSNMKTDLDKAVQRNIKYEQELQYYKNKVLEMKTLAEHQMNLAKIAKKNLNSSKVKYETIIQDLKNKMAPKVESEDVPKVESEDVPNVESEDAQSTISIESPAHVIPENQQAKNCTIM